MRKIYLLLALLLLNLNLYAEVKDKFKLNLGTMWVSNFETEMQMAPKKLPLGVRINTQDQLGMKNDTNVFRLDGYYRFTDTHSVAFSYFSVKSDGHTSAGEDISFDGVNIGAGASLDSYFNMDVYKLSYGYSFYHNEDVELLLSIGLHVTTIDLGIKAQGHIVLDDNSVTGSYSGSGSTIIPLPVIGFKGEYAIIRDKLYISYKSEYFSMEYEDYKGNLLSAVLNIEYRFMDHVGIGVGYNTNRLYVKGDDGKNVLEAKNDVSGAMFYMTYIY